MIKQPMIQLKARFVDESVGIDRWNGNLFGSWQFDKANVDVQIHYTPSYINNNFENTFFRSEIPRAKVSVVARRST